MKRSKYTEAQIVALPQEAASGRKSQAGLCREHGVSENTFYIWKLKCAGLRPRTSSGFERLRAKTLNSRSFWPSETWRSTRRGRCSEKRLRAPEPVSGARVLMGLSQ